MNVFISWRSASGVDTASLLKAVQSAGSGCTRFVEQDISVFTAAETTWGLDSLDGVDDGAYVRHYGGKGVEVYVIDTGIDSDHSELAGLSQKKTYKHKLSRLPAVGSGPELVRMKL